MSSSSAVSAAEAGDETRAAPTGDGPSDMPPPPRTPAAQAARVRALPRGPVIVPPRPPLPQPPIRDEADTVVAPQPTASGGVRAVLTLRGVSKSFAGRTAIDNIDLCIPEGTFFGLVGPNGAGKTTTLSVASGLLRADHGVIVVHDVDAVAHPRRARRLVGMLPDHLYTFDRLTGSQLLFYCGLLHGLSADLVRSRMADLVRAFGLGPAMHTVVADCSTGMAKKVLLAAAMLHAPRLLVLDEPFEAVDPVSAEAILDALRAYVEHGGSVLVASHGMELVERMCSQVAIMMDGGIAVQGTVADVRGGRSLQERFVELTGPSPTAEDVEWLQSFSA